MYGIDMKNMFINNRLGTTTKNFDFIFCDFIKHPIASKIKDIINKIVSVMIIVLKLTKKMEDTILSKLFI